VRSYLEKPFNKIGLVGWLKVKDLNSSPSTDKKKLSDIKADGGKFCLLGNSYILFFKFHMG
jgi:hypothetical protein